MGSAIERFLAETGGRHPQGTAVDQFVSDTGGVDPKALELATRQPVAPERAARILTLKQRHGLSPEFIDRNFDALDAHDRSTDLNLEQLRAQSPTLAAWMAEHPTNAGAVKDDIRPLSRMESLFVALAGPRMMSSAYDVVIGRRAGAATSEQGRIGYDSRSHGGYLSDDQRSRLQALEREVAVQPGGRDFLTRAVFGSAKILGQLMETAPIVGAGASAGAVLGGTLGLLGGPLSPITVPAAAALGASFGATAATVVDVMAIEGGHMYLDLGEFRDENGIGIDEGTRQSLSMAVGGVNGLLELGGLHAIAAPFKAVGRRFMRDAARDALMRPTMRLAMNDFARSYGVALGGELGTEVLQEMSSVIGEEFAKLGSDGNFDSLLSSDEERERAMVRIAQVARETVEGMALLALPGASIHGATSAHAARQATQREQYFTALGEAASESKALSRLPDVVQELVRRQTADGPISTVYAPTEQFVSYFQSAKLDPAGIAKELGLEGALEEAQRTGADLAIPMHVYATRIAPTEHNAFFAKELRLRPNEMNAREAAALLDAIEQASEDETVPGQADAKQIIQGASVGSLVAEQLQAAGYEKTVADAQGRIYETAFRTLGARAGIDPVALFNRYDFSITRSEPTATLGAGPRLSLADVANRALVFREMRAEREGLEAEGEPQTPYQVARDRRDAAARTDDKTFVYARTDKGALRGNLTSVATDGLIEELAYLYEQQQQDAEKNVPTIDLDEDMHSMDGTRAYVGKKTRAVHAAGRILQRAKAIARVEAELAGRNVENLEQKVYGRIIGDESMDVDFDPSTFQQSPLPRHPIVERFLALRGLEQDPNVSPDIREEAAKRAAAIEPQARAEYRKQFDAANATMASDPDAILYHQSPVPPSLDDLLAALKARVAAGEESSIKLPPGASVRDLFRRDLIENLTDMEPAEWWDALTTDQRRSYLTRLHRAPEWAPFDSKKRPPQKQWFLSETINAAFRLYADDVRGSVAFSQAFPGGDAPRGQIRFKIGENAAVDIALLADADLSTFLHETGHFYLEVMRDLATTENAAAGIVADFDAIKRWVNWQEGQTAFAREQHEQWARGFEAYLMEGKAPSAELRSAFGRFRAWLVRLYRSYESLNVFLSDEVRGVMDRLLASADEIAAAQREQHMEPLFADPVSVGMSQQQAARYRSVLETHRQTAEEEVARKLIAEVQREQNAIYQAERRRVRAEVAEEVNQERDSMALAFLARGTMPDGSPLPAELEAVKLSKTALVGEYVGRPGFPNLLARLRSRFLYAKEGSVHPDQVAEWFGYPSGDELLQALLTYQGTPQQRIERLTDERMRAEDPNLVTPAELPLEAMKAVHNEERAQVLHLELAHLVSQDFATFKGLVRRVARRLPPLMDVRLDADRIIRHKKIRDLNPLVYQRAEVRAARLAVEAALAGNWDVAFDEKQRELLNHELYRAATAARDRVDAVASDMARFGLANVRERLGKAGGDYLEQIDDVLDRFDFRKSVSKRQLDRRRSLRAWYDEQVAAGLAPLIPAKLLDDAYRTHYRELTSDEFDGIHDAVLSIEHLAKLKTNLMASARARALEVVRQEIVDGIAAHHDIVTPQPEGHEPKTARWRLGKFSKKTLAEHTRMEFLFDFLDGYKGAGPVWEYLFKPFADAETQENAMLAATAAEMQRIMAVYTRAERAAWFDQKITIAAAKSAKHTGVFTKEAILAVALNWGNDYNRQALLEGFGWRMDQAEAVLDHLDRRDWTVVQALLDHISSYWPQVEQLEKDLNGIAPQKVEATPFMTKTGQSVPGGYYPIIFDRERSLRQAKYDEAASVHELFGGNWARAMTRHGHTIERTATGGKALKLEIAGMTDHLGQVIHDLAFRRPVIDVYRILQEKEVQEAIARAAGSELYKQLGPWLHGIAGDRQREFGGTMESLFGRIRQGATVVGLGLKVTSAIMQSLGYLNATKELGVVWATRGLRDAYGDPRRIRDKWAFITARSPMMTTRLENYDRDVRDYARRHSLLDDRQKAWFIFIGYMDLATSIPAWLGAYRKAMDGGLEGVEKADEPRAIDYADKVVRETQAAGASKDLAYIQRGGEAWRLFTMFYSSLSILFNQFDRTRREFQLERNIGKLAGALALLWFIPAVAEQIIRGQEPDDDESWAAFYGKKLVAYPFATVILLRDFVASLDRRGYDGSPALQAIDRISRAVKSVVKPFTDDDVTRADVRAWVDAVGITYQLPTAQVWKSLEYLYDWLVSGEEDPDNVISGIYRTTITGKPRQ